MHSKVEYPESCRLSGELQERAALNCTRLHTAGFYASDVMYKAMDYAWPGDFEGRLMLAWQKHVSLSGKADPELAHAVELYNRYCNHAGYLGPVHPADLIDEQQLSGHGWLLRALSEMYIAEPNDFCRNTARNIFENLALPLLDHLPTYPVHDGERKSAGAVDGTADKRVGVWRLSTDIGAVFIFFAGLVHAAEVFELPAEKLLSEFVALAKRVEFVEVKCQTHASLTLARGLLRYSQLYKDASAEELAFKIYELYKLEGMSVTCANYNWFRRPEWTEPCAVVDSFMVAMELYRRSGRTAYLDDAHFIWYSAMERAQRPNGGFGGESCVCRSEHDLYMKFYEAVNCCSMRAAEGIFERAMKSIWREESTLFMAVPTNGEFAFADGLRIKVTANYPVGDIWNVEIIEQGKTPVEKVLCYIPGHGWMAESGKQDEFELIKEPVAGTGRYFFRRGPVIYGSDGNGCMRPVNELYKLTDAEAKELRLKIIFE